MTQPPAEGESIFDTPQDKAAKKTGEQPQTPQRERSGIFGEPAGVGPDSVGTSDGSEREDPIREQVPTDGDHWRR